MTMNFKNIHMMVILTATLMVSISSGICVSPGSPSKGYANGGNANGGNANGGPGIAGLKKETRILQHWNRCAVLEVMAISLDLAVLHLRN